MAQSSPSRAAIFIARELVGEVLYFPVWWYSQGLILTLRTLWRQWENAVDRLALRIMFRTMGQPMYGDYTRSGRVISFFMRLFLIFVKLIALGFWTVVLMAGIILWLIGPVGVVAMLIYQLSGMVYG